MDQTIIQAGLASAQAVVNKALAYDPATLQKVQKLSPKVLAIEITQPAITVYIQFAEEMTLSSHYEYEPDATLKGELSAFFNLARSQDKHAALMQSDIQIHGSSQLAMGLAKIMEQLDIDFEAMLAEVAGPVTAHILGNKFRKLGGWLKSTGDKFKADTTEYVRDELQLAPHKLEGESQFVLIHKLKLDAERLEAKIARVAQLINS